MRCYLLTMFGFVIPAISCVAAQDFVLPIGGTPYEDWTIVNYVDLDPSSDIEDWRGGGYTYNGHNAIDFTLPNFAAMDAGVDVYAARSGTVIHINDGEYDRWSRVNPNPGDLPNYVVIDHGGGIVTEYLHLKNSSIPVAVGQSVSAGQKIGEVGSSGYSSDAHLHFAVYDSGTVVETYLDPASWWESPLAYAGDVAGTLDFGIVDHIPTTAELVDRPIDHDVFYRSDGSGQVAYSWVNLFGFDPGDDLDYYFYRPDGSEQAHWHWTTGEIRYGWWYAGIGLPAVPALGEWTLTAQRNGTTLYSDSFWVHTSPGDFTGDGIVDGNDFLTWQRDPNIGNLADWQANYGDGGMLTGTLAVPEPTTLAVVCIALIFTGSLPVFRSYRFRLGANS
ncbi:M23 family metallopeptidase [Bythopirellula goksoeyrii]|uniref:Putative peptidase n=1 Tax=Bythopirellula goksoeyrii TaxID=1400387 RepID=A0A5B9Q838_9BACT|nr:M23 family metallopeptidase [Bythopirellula goksoeyrii]QEG33582.1 putative peptidase [Bythopirellula goksoeyrii]